VLKKPSFFVSRPDEWMEKKPWLQEDNIALYEKIERVLNEEGYPYTVSGEIKITPETHDICLAHHTVMERPNVWNLKKGYLPGYINWDRTGYSGWAEMANSERLFQESQRLGLEECVRFFEPFAKRYIESNASKFPQAAAAGPFQAPRPYVFVACQRPHDTVSQLSRIGTVELAQAVAEAFQGSGCTVVIKKHPRDEIMRTHKLERMPHVLLSEDSIHHIIPGSSAVITVNSGVGFEALLHLKPVFTSGHCDYHWVTTKLASREDVQNIPERLGQPPPRDQIIKFVTYMLKEYFVNAYDLDSVRKKVAMCVREWQLHQGLS
jgi:Capsule polysaccharide biosynthesis protein